MVNKVEALSPLTNPLLPEWAVSGEKTRIQRVLVMDVGSTNMKFAFWHEGQSLTLPDAKTPDTSKFRNIHFKDFTGLQYIVNPAGYHVFKTADGGKILSAVRGTVEEMEKINGSADMYVLTGFTNSLAVIDNVDGRPNIKAVLLDDPSATTQLEPRQYAAIWHSMHDKTLFEREGVKPTSSLMKIIFLENNLGGAHDLFGQLKFSTMRGVITKMLLDMHDPVNTLPFVVPAGGDTRAFAGGNVGLDRDETALLLRGMGVRRNQINLLAAPMVVHQTPDGREIKIYNVQDFEANLWLIEQLINLGQIPDDADYIEWDSVVKGAQKRNPSDIAIPGLKTLAGMEYVTQRMGANAINIPGRQLAEQDWHLGGSWDWDYYAFLKILFEEYVSRPSERFFYYPDKGITGTLVDTAGGMVKVVDPTTDLTKAGYNHDEIKEMVVAALCGSAFGARKKQEEIRLRRKISAPLKNCMYGGLVCYDENAAKIIAQCLSGDVFMLGMPYAGQAAFLQAMHELRALKENFPRIKTWKVEHGSKRDEEYERWKKYY